MPFLAGSEPELSVYTRLPVTLVRGHGCRVWDDQGKEYVDFYGGHAVAALGYGHPALVSAIQAQVAELLFQTNAVDLAIRGEALAKLVETAPPHLRRAFLVNSGAEAVEAALRLAFLKTGRTRVTALRGAFHGRTAAAAAITDGNDTWYGFPNAPFAVDWVGPEDFDRLDDVLTEETAAFIFEPVQGVAGAVDLSPGFLRQAARLSAERGALLIADEVQTGIGRTGTLYAVEQLGVAPDLLTTAKGLGGGFPVSALLTTDEVGRVAKPGSLGTTFGGGPVACAAMKAVLETVSEPAFLAGVRERSAKLRMGCLYAGARRVTGMGFLLGAHVGRPVKDVRAALLERGFLTGDAKDPQVLRLLPPLTVSLEEIDAFCSALGEVLA
ncbi:MAG: aminotransferase class III-fold pyridoxal phosphate-dependent enzyme [Fimbriimonadaceae bacterium]|nr:MAG: aminotransferase class III-fold pyridoxal phosphate-dependent enzyme [Fimbriimonadaceae bacterium]